MQFRIIIYSILLCYGMSNILFTYHMIVYQTRSGLIQAVDYSAFRKLVLLQPLLEKKQLRRWRRSEVKFKLSVSEVGPDFHQQFKFENLHYHYCWFSTEQETDYYSSLSQYNPPSLQWPHAPPTSLLSQELLLDSQPHQPLSRWG